MKYIDLRSDTVTLPTESMLKAMRSAEMGDDVYGEDPTVNRLQDMAAERMGKEAGLFVPSGTMGNLIAILVHCGRGDEAIMGNKAHTFLYEAGGVSALGGIVMYTLPNNVDGTLNLEDIRSAIRAEDVHFPKSRLIVLENTQNRCGGAPISAEYTQSVSDIARENDLFLHIDGARIFNAAAELGVTAEALVKPADTVTFCLSKGLCAPVGSVLCGSKEFIKESLRIRKQLGGGMRQAGVLAAAGIVALEEMTERLVEDHKRAKTLAEGLLKIPGLKLYLNPPTMTNMVFVEVSKDAGLETDKIIEHLKKSGIIISASGDLKFRLVTHYWVDDTAVEKTISAFKQLF